MSNMFYHDIQQQPHSLRQLNRFYCEGPGRELLESLYDPTNLILTGMGASFHAAMIVAPLFHINRIPVLAIESIDLLNYSLSGLVSGSTLVYASQSGASGEVIPVVEQTKNLIAVTNEETSPLALHANSVFPIQAGFGESGVACSAYVNTVAALWLMARKWSGIFDNTEFEQLSYIADRVEYLLEQAETSVELWMNKLEKASTLIFIGHGPHSATARHTAMMLGEWPKQPALSYGLGAFRHGPIEIITPDMGVVIFASTGTTDSSAKNLAQELTEIGAKVLLVENGVTHGVWEHPSNIDRVDEFLAPILDVIPGQLFAEALARRLNVPPKFRYIQKVVTAL
jgi:glutamine---fructose-6-phosphate transaminase (isomerizing)